MAVAGMVLGYVMSTLALAALIWHFAGGTLSDKIPSQAPAAGQQAAPVPASSGSK
jgi:hypothetical protein